MAAQVAGQQVLVGNLRLLHERLPEAITDGWIQRKEALEAEGKTAMLVAVGGQLAGIIAVADTLRPEARQAVDELKKLGLAVTMPTGDNRHTAQAIARQLGIERVIAEVAPQEKVAEIRRLQDAAVAWRGRFGAREQRGLVAMVGDGINDAPALVQADIGIALGTGTDVAAEASDITLLQDDLLGVGQAIRLSQQTLRVIKQNFVYAFLFNGLGLPSAALGYLSPLIASPSMGVSSLLVVGNSLRLKRVIASTDRKASTGLPLA